jgi:hypothetical protein
VALLAGLSAAFIAVSFGYLHFDDSRSEATRCSSQAMRGAQTRKSVLDLCCVVDLPLGYAIISAVRLATTLIGAVAENERVSDTDVMLSARTHPADGGCRPAK